MSDDLHRIQAAYAAHHLMGYAAAGLTTFTAVANWWRAQELQREHDPQAEIGDRPESAQEDQEDQDGTNDPSPTSHATT
jgi:hypothetical protein